jgi:histidyl-tRNA synthetase
MERLLLIMDNLGIDIPKPVRYDVMLIGLGSEAKDKCFTLARALRERGVSVDLDLMDRSVKAQMKYADKTGALYTLVIGDEEMSNNAANLKSMQNGESVMVQLDAESIANSMQRG